MEPRKNIRRLINAFCSCPEHIKDHYQLVIAGGKGWLSSDIYRAVVENGVESRVKFLGYVDDMDLPWLYCGATCFVYPSLYEGFGLPPLEAMASGVPVIASNTSSLPEVLGDSGLLVDPQDPECLKWALVELLENESLRRSLSASALTRSATFSWDRTAAQTLRIYQDVY
jgi:alpha-1,3-rhamnosyl/mannosyltransferase